MAPVPQVLRHIAVLGDAAHPDVRRWCKNLAKTGPRVTLVSFETGAVEGVDLVRLSSGIDMAGSVLSKLGYIGHVAEVRKVLRRIRADVVVPYYVGTYCLLAMLSGVRPVVPFAVGSDITLPDGRWWRMQRQRAILRRVPMLMTIAPHLSELAVRMGVPETRIFCCPVGIETEPFSRNRCTLPAANDELRIICTRALSPIYNIDILLRAVQQVRATRQVTATIVGDGPARRELLALARELAIEDSVVFTGRVTHPDIPGLLAAHNVYASLPQTDGVSSSLLEAMAAGLLPVVPRNTANSGWIKHGETGCLLDRIDPDAVAEALLQATGDLALRRRAFEQNIRTVRGRAEASRQAIKFRDALLSFEC